MTDQLTNDLTGHNSHFMNMAYLASLGFCVVPGAIGTIKDGIFIAECEYRFEPGVGVHVKRSDGKKEFIPFHPSEYQDNK